MLEEMQRLHDSLPLRQLLDHYAQRGAADRQVWQDRLMSLEGVPAPELTRLHGELLAFEWLEMNVGVTTGAGGGGVPGCYRVTVAGLRAWKHAQGGFWLEDEEEPAKPTRPFPRRRKRTGHNGADPVHAPPDGEGPPNGPIIHAPALSPPQAMTPSPN